MSAAGPLPTRSLPLGRKARSAKGHTIERRRAAPKALAPAPRLVLAVQYAVRAQGVPVPRTLRRWATAALDHDACVTLRFVGEAEARALNARHRRRDYATNVLTFVYDGALHATKDAPPLAGDIVICAPVVRREARAQRRPLRAHYAHLVVHGMLHLQGYDHENEDEAAAMEARESKILRALRYPDPYV